MLSAEGFGREVRTVQIDGLRITGRELPASTVGPVDVWDPVRSLLQQRDLANEDQDSSTLLLRLWASLTGMSDDGASHLDRVLSILAELDRRGIPTDRVIRAALLPQLASQISLQVLALILFPEDEAAALAEFSNAQPWLELAAAFVELHPRATAYEMVGSPADANNRSRGMNYSRMLARLADPLVGKVDASSDDDTSLGEFQRRLLEDPVATFVVSPGFLHRVQHWLEARFNHGVAALLSDETPVQAVFNAMPVRPPSVDPLGNWVWDRFTTVDINEWETDSLVWEWGHQRGDRDELPSRTLNERNIPAETLTGLVIDRLTLHAIKAPPSQTMKPDQFVHAAIDKLKSGNPSDAADIFRALVDLDPTDAEARNNLGFCLIPSDAERGLEALETATRLKLANPALCSINRALALCELRRFAEAAAILDGLDDAELAKAGPAYLWVPHQDGQDSSLTLEFKASPLDYAASLRTHIARMQRAVNQPG